MNIWVMRHGEAGFNASTDRERSLTENGKKTAYQQGQWLAKRLLNQQLNLDKILVSPYLRTQQTWQAVLAGMQAVEQTQSFAKLAQVMETWDGITPAGSARLVLDYARFLRDEGAQNLLIISHLPLVFDLVEQFSQHQASVHFYPAVIAELDWKQDQGKLIATQYP